MFIRAKQQVLILIAAVTLVVGFIVFRYLPLRRESSALEKEYSQRKAAVAKLPAKEAEMNELREQLEQYEKILADFDRKIPAETRLGDFLGLIAGMMDEHRLTQQNIAPHQRINAGKLAYIPVTMRCTGRLEQIRDFYESLQGLDRAVRIEKFSLKNDSQYTGQIRMETEAIIYHRNTEDGV